MILSFSKDSFKEKILNRTKTTTIRKGNRWKMIHKIHFWRGNPRNKGSYPFAFSYVEHIQDITVIPNGCICDGVLDITVDGKDLNKEEIATLIRKEGFDSEEEFKAFFPERITGQLITWACMKPINQKGVEHE